MHTCNSVNTQKLEYEPISIFFTYCKRSFQIHHSNEREKKGTEKIKVKIVNRNHEHKQNIVNKNDCF